MTTKTEAPAVAATRAETFKAEVAELKIKDPNAGYDTYFLWGGLALMVVGIALSIVGYIMSHGTTSSLTQNDAVTVGIIGVSLTVAGGAVFLRYSFAQFMRFWLARFIYESRARD